MLEIYDLKGHVRKGASLRLVSLSAEGNKAKLTTWQQDIWKRWIKPSLVEMRSIEAHLVQSGVGISKTVITLRLGVCFGQAAQPRANF